MSNEKTFAVAGWSVLDGVKKPRFAKDMLRVKVLERNGHKDIVLYPLPTAMTKEQALEWLNNMGGTVLTTAPAAQLPNPLVPDANLLLLTFTPEPVAMIDQQMGVAQYTDEELSVAPQPKMSFEEALAQIPLRENGKFVSKAVREARAKELMWA